MWLILTTQFDIVYSGAVDGYIHALGIDETGSRLAVAHGAFVGVVDRPFNAGKQRGEFDNMVLNSV